MGESILCLLVIAVSVTCLYATTSDFALVSMMTKDLDEYFPLIQELSPNLTESQKMFLYNSNEKSTTMPFVLNLLLGCGIGSYVQGDSKGGTTALLGDLGSTAAALAGMMMMESEVYASYFSGGNYNETPVIMGSILAVAGGISAVCFRIYECVRPFSYAKSYNKKLVSALYGDAGKSPVISFTPDLQSLAGGNLGMTVAATIPLD